MNYELALELKNSGFPQEGDRPGDVVSGLVNEDGSMGRLYYPILEELIEACGDGVFTLGRFKDFDEEGNMGWIATSRLTPSRSKTPIEAVARLWLALNKK